MHIPEDQVHQITIGTLPAWRPPPDVVGTELDFIAVHIYPSTGKVAEAIKNLKQFDIGKPIAVEETFPLSCGADDERDFLLQSRRIAAGWIGQYPDETPIISWPSNTPGRSPWPRAQRSSGAFELSSVPRRFKVLNDNRWGFTARRIFDRLPPA
jgi:hypothetical protein